MNLFAHHITTLEDTKCLSNLHQSMNPTFATGNAFHSPICAMTSTFTPSVSKFHHPTVSSPIRSLMNKLIGRNSDTLPRKLATTPFASSLLSPPSPDEILQRQLQLQQIVDIVVLSATWDKKYQLVITLKLALKSETPREQVGIFIPNNAAVTHETTLTFHDVNQLGRVLAFCVDKSTRDCDENCKCCSEFGTYLGNHWARDPLVTVVNMGDTVLRKPSLAMHLARLVTFATGKSTATPRVAAVSKDNGVAGIQFVPQLSRIGKSEVKEVKICAAQNEVAAVLYDFFNVFTQTSKTVASSTTKEL